MKFSVITPCYHCEATIRRCAESLFTQSYRDCEFIFVEDGEEVTGLAEITAQDARAKVLRVPHGGVARARNAGLAAVGGGYVTFCDADDYYGENLIQNYADALSTEELDWYCLDVVNHKKDGLLERKIKNPPKEATENLKALFGEPCSGIISAVVWDKCYRTDTIRQNSICFPPEGTGWEDWSFNVEFGLVAGRLGKVKNCANADYHYVVTESSLSNQSVTFASTMGCYASVCQILTTLERAGRHDDWLLEAETRVKLSIHYLLLSSGPEGIAKYREVFPEVHSPRVVWRMTRKASLRYRLRLLSASLHLHPLYQIAFGMARSVWRLLRYIRNLIP